MDYCDVTDILIQGEDLMGFQTLFFTVFKLLLKYLLAMLKK